MPVTPDEARAYIGKNVEITWTYNEEEAKYYGRTDGGMEGVVERLVDDDTMLVLDWGMGATLNRIDSIKEIPIRTG